MLVFCKKAPILNPGSSQDSHCEQLFFLNLQTIYKPVTSTRDRDISAAYLLYFKHKLYYLILTTPLRGMDYCVHFMYAELRE